MNINEGPGSWRGGQEALTKAPYSHWQGAGKALTEAARALSEPTDPDTLADPSASGSMPDVCARPARGGRYSRAVRTPPRRRVTWPKAKEGRV